VLIIPCTLFRPTVFPSLFTFSYSCRSLFFCDFYYTVGFVCPRVMLFLSPLELRFLCSFPPPFNSEKETLSLKTAGKLKLCRMFPVHNPEADDDVNVCLVLNA